MNLFARLIVILLPLVPLSAESTLRFCLRSEPRTFDPLLVEDSSSGAIRYLTGGVLVRLNRKTQVLDPALATRWKVSEGGRRIDFDLRPGVKFSDGSPFGPEDVIATLQRTMDPKVNSPMADAFGGPGPVEARATGPLAVMVRFEKPVAAIAGQFDQVVVAKANAGLGPFVMAEHKPGISVLLRKNPNYWEKDAQGRKLPYLDSLQLDIQQNRETEALRLERGELDLVQSLDPELFDRMSKNPVAGVQMVDAGASLDSEQMWFNLAPGAKYPAYKRAWFADPAFRRAVSAAIHRDDICRLIYRGHAVPALGPVSASNKFWFDRTLAPRPAPATASKELAAAGFAKKGDQLFDKAGHPVEFSLASNAGNKVRERMMAMIQQDLAQLGIHVNTVSLDFASLIERMTRTFDYEACLLSMTNVDVDPNGEMNVWLSSSPNHQWNPSQKTPETKWEAEVDELMRQQAESQDLAVRKKAFDRVQHIIREQEPFIFLVNPNALSAVSRRVQNVSPTFLLPQTYWNIERLSVTR